MTLVSSFSLSPVYAQENVDIIKLCNNSTLDLRMAPIGYKCQTSKGVIYERVEYEVRQGVGTVVTFLKLW